MKTSKAAIAALAVLLCGILATESAFAQGRRGGPRVGIYVGVPVLGFGYGYGGFYPPPYYYPPYYYHPPYYPAPVVVQQQPTVYVEQPAPQAQPQQQQQPAGYWYYCADSRAYYPYVRECPAGWQRVAPQPG
jgi:hypothetical protein